MGPKLGEASVEIDFDDQSAALGVGPAKLSYDLAQRRLDAGVGLDGGKARGGVNGALDTNAISIGLGGGGGLLFNVKPKRRSSEGR